MKAGLYAGAAKVDITPERPISLIPTKEPQRSSKGITRRLRARVIVIRQEARHVIFISADCLFIPLTCVANLKKRIAETWSLNSPTVIIHATHTHSAPFPASGYYASVYDSSLDAEYDGYIQEMEEHVLAGVGVALAALEPVTAERGSGKCGFSSYRRNEVDGKVTMTPNEDGPKDPEVTVVRFRKADGGIKALMVHYACHPTTTYEDFLSPDYAGTAMEQLEESLGDDVVSLFLQGCCGDVRPGLVRDGHYYHGTDADVVRLARQLSDETLAVLDRPMQAVTAYDVKSRELDVELPFREVPTWSELEAWRDDPGLMGKRSRKLLANPQYWKSHETLQLSYIRLADELQFLTMSGEMVAAYGHYIKSAGGGRVVPVGYSNGNAGYVPTARQLEEGGYEAYDFFYLHGFPSPYDPSIEAIIHGAIDTLIGNESIG